MFSAFDLYIECVLSGAFQTFTDIEEELLRLRSEAFKLTEVRGVRGGEPRNQLVRLDNMAKNE